MVPVPKGDHSAMLDYEQEQSCISLCLCISWQFSVQNPYNISKRFKQYQGKKSKYISIQVLNVLWLYMYYAVCSHQKFVASSQVTHPHSRLFDCKWLVSMWHRLSVDPCLFLLWDFNTIFYLDTFHLANLIVLRGGFFFLSKADYLSVWSFPERKVQMVLALSYILYQT